MRDAVSIIGELREIFPEVILPLEDICKGRPVAIVRDDFAVIHNGAEIEAPPRGTQVRRLHVRILFQRVVNQAGDVRLNVARNFVFPIIGSESQRHSCVDQVAELLFQPVGSVFFFYLSGA